MKKRLDIEDVRKYLIDDLLVQDEINRTFKSDATTVLQSLRKGEDPSLNEVDIDSFLLNILLNNGRLYKRYTARGSFGNYPIDIRGLGGVYFYWAPEFDTEGYFLNIDDAAEEIGWSWADNLVSNNGRSYRPPFLRSSDANE